MVSALPSMKQDSPVSFIVSLRTESWHFVVLWWQAKDSLLRPNEADAFLPNKLRIPRLFSRI